MAAIYILTNKINGKQYVGQTRNIERRLNHHKKYYANFIISKAIKKYGWDMFDQHIFYILENDLDYFEIEMIKRLNTLAPNGYNLESGGNKNKYPSAETRKKLSEVTKGKNNPMFGRTGIKCPMFGKQHTEETKKKISEAQKGEKGYMFGKMGEKSHSFGRHHSKEAKLKISKARIGIILSKEHREKISEAGKGRKHSDEAKARMSKAQKGKSKSKEYKIKMSIARRGVGNPMFGKKHSPETIVKMKVAWIKRKAQEVAA